MTLSRAYSSAKAQQSPVSAHLSTAPEKCNGFFLGPLSILSPGFVEIHPVVWVILLLNQLTDGVKTSLALVIRKIYEKSLSQNTLGLIQIEHIKIKYKRGSSKDIFQGVLSLLRIFNLYMLFLIWQSEILVSYTSPAKFLHTLPTWIQTWSFLSLIWFAFTV